VGNWTYKHIIKQYKEENTTKAKQLKMLTKTAVKFVVVALPWLLWRWTTSIILANEVPAKDIHLSKPPKIVTVVDQNGGGWP
jgi:hypothetical protein